MAFPQPSGPTQTHQPSPHHQQHYLPHQGGSTTTTIASPRPGMNGSLNNQQQQQQQQAPPTSLPHVIAGAPSGVVLVTGGTGFLGKEIIRHLLLHPVSLANHEEGSGENDNGGLRQGGPLKTFVSVVAVVRSSSTSVDEFHIPDAEARKRLHLVVMNELNIDTLNTLPLNAATVATPAANVVTPGSFQTTGGTPAIPSAPPAAAATSTNSAVGISAGVTGGSTSSTSAYAGGFKGNRNRMRGGGSPGLRPFSPGMDSIAKLGPLLGIIHCAGLVRHSKRPRDIHEMHKANIEASNAIFRFAKLKAVRCIYASSSGVIGCQKLNEKNASPAGGPNVFGREEDSTTVPIVSLVDNNTSPAPIPSSLSSSAVPQPQDTPGVPSEDSPYCLDAVSQFPYYLQKIEVENTWKDMAKEGDVDIIFMRPSLLLGPGDDRLSGTRLLYDVCQSKCPFLVPGGVSIVDVRDTAHAFVNALFASKTLLPSGSAVNLSACNMTAKTLVDETARCAGVKPPRFTVMPFLVRAGAYCLTCLNFSTMRPYDPSTDPTFAEMGLRYWNVNSNSEFARRTCGFNPRSIRRTLEDTVDYIVKVQIPRGRAGEAASRAAAAANNESPVVYLRRVLHSRYRWLVLLCSMVAFALTVWVFGQHLPFHATPSASA